MNKRTSPLKGVGQWIALATAALFTLIAFIFTRVNSYRVHVTLQDSFADVLYGGKGLDEARREILLQTFRSEADWSGRVLLSAACLNLVICLCFLLRQSSGDSKPDA